MTLHYGHTSQAKVRFHCPPPPALTKYLYPLETTQELGEIVMQLSWVGKWVRHAFHCGCNAD